MRGGNGGGEREKGRDMKVKDACHCKVRCDRGEGRESERKGLYRPNRKRKNALEQQNKKHREARIVVQEVQMTNSHLVWQEVVQTCS